MLIIIPPQPRPGCEPSQQLSMDREIVVEPIHGKQPSSDHTSHPVPLCLDFHLDRSIDRSDIRTSSFSLAQPALLLIRYQAAEHTRPSAPPALLATRPGETISTTAARAVRGAPARHCLRIALVAYRNRDRDSAYTLTSKVASKFSLTDTTKVSH